MLEANYVGLLDFICRQQTGHATTCRRAHTRTFLFFFIIYVPNFFPNGFWKVHTGARQMAFQFLDNLPVIFHSTAFPVVVVVVVVVLVTATTVAFCVSVDRTTKSKIKSLLSNMQQHKTQTLWANCHWKVITQWIPWIVYLCWIYIVNINRNRINFGISNLQAQ